MKKFIGAIVILAILGGLAYYFLASNLLMTTIFTQDKLKTVSVLNNALDKVAKANSLDLTIVTKKSDNGVSTPISTLNLQTGKNGNADVLFAQLTVTDDSGIMDVADGLGTTTIYYDGTDIYKKFAPAGGGSAVYTKPDYGTADPIEFALGLVMNYDLYQEIAAKNLTAFYGDGVSSLSLPLAELNINDKTAGITSGAGMAFNWNPLIIGLGISVQKEDNPGDNSDGATSQSRWYGISLENNLIQAVQKSGSKAQYTSITINYNKIGGVSVTLLSTQESGNWAVVI